MKVRLLVLIAVLAFAPHLLLSQDFTVGANCSVHVTKALPDTINDFFNTADIVGYIEEYAKEGRVRIEGKRIEVGIAYKESLMLTLRFLNYDPSEYRNKSEFNYVRVEPSDWLELILARWLSASIMSISDTTIKSKMLQDSALFVLSLERAKNYRLLMMGRINGVGMGSFLPMLTLVHPELGDVNVSIRGRLDTGWGWPLGESEDPITKKRSLAYYVREFLGVAP